MTFVERRITVGDNSSPIRTPGFAAAFIHCWSGIMVMKLLSCNLIAFLLLTMATPANAALHFWGLKEIYSNGSGSVQFIEMFTSSNNQQFTNGATITISNGVDPNNVFTFPSNTPSPTGNHHLLLATSGFQAVAGFAPDFVIPDDFLFTGGGNISFFGTNSGPYTALPTDGIMSRNWSAGTDQVNSPTRYDGTTMSIAPEPSLLLAAGGAYGLFALAMRRRRS